MHIFIDESGSFVPSRVGGSWCVVAGYVVPERSRGAAEAVLLSAKRAIGATASTEVKLKHFTEAAYAEMLTQLSRVEGVLYAAAIDAGAHSYDVIRNHHTAQLAQIRKNVPLMRYESARAGLSDLAARFDALSPQLYMQLVVQVALVESVIRRSTLFLVQRIPASLSRFRWRVDRKNVGTSIFDRLLVDLAPALLQAASLNDPQLMLRGPDYSHFDRFQFADGVPKHLAERTGSIEGHDVGKIMREDMKFVDSAGCRGVQLADLLASGVRRLLRGGFADSATIAERLGALMVMDSGGRPPIRLMTMCAQGAAERHVAEVAKVMRTHCKNMMLVR